MATYSINKPCRTVMLHKDVCRQVKEGSNGCACRHDGNQQWFCEKHAAIDGITEWMGQNRPWAVLLCTQCH